MFKSYSNFTEETITIIIYVIDTFYIFKMKYMLQLINDLTKLFPYFLLIALYFFFVNLEASNYNTKNKKIDLKNKINNNSIENINILNYKKSNKMQLPVFPYEEN